MRSKGYRISNSGSRGLILIRPPSHIVKSCEVDRGVVVSLTATLGDLSGIVSVSKVSSAVNFGRIEEQNERKKQTHSVDRDRGSQEKMSEPRNAPMKIQMMMYPL